MIGPQTQIHVTDFQQLVTQLHSAHISPIYIRADRIRLHKAFLPLKGFYMTANRCVHVLAGLYMWLCDCESMFMSLCG